PLPSNSNHFPCTDLFPLSLHDALPILFHRFVKKNKSPPQRITSACLVAARPNSHRPGVRPPPSHASPLKSLSAQKNSFPLASPRDRKITRLNSSHGSISYAVFCLKKKQ